MIMTGYTLEEDICNHTYDPGRCHHDSVDECCDDVVFA